MKFLQLCLAYAEDSGQQEKEEDEEGATTAAGSGDIERLKKSFDKPFVAFLKGEKLSPALQEVLQMDTLTWSLRLSLSLNSILPCISGGPLRHCQRPTRPGGRQGL